MTRVEARWRDALLASILPAPGRGLPALADVDLSSFWPRFAMVAPFHLRLALRAASVLVGGVLPWVLGHYGSLDGLDPDAREEVVARAHRLPGLSALLDVVKLVACMAYFSDPVVQATARRRA